MQATVRSEEMAIFSSYSKSSSEEIVCIIDSDAHARAALAEILVALGRTVRTFASAREYLESRRADSVACVVLDIQLPDMSGLDLQNQLRGVHGPPMIFISGRTNIPETVRALKGGAIDFLTKPVDATLLNMAIDAAFAQDRRRKQARAHLTNLQLRFASLTPREREVLPLVTGGLLNKQSAAALGISEVTLQMHRSQIMRKMQARSFAELVRMAEKLEVLPWDARDPYSAKGEI
jgi:FixJ family two-component response regulator